MKRFLWKCGLLLLSMGVILGISGVFYRQTNTYKNMVSYIDTAKFDAMPQTIDVAIFGNSHARESIREIEGVKNFFNFSLSGQTIQYDARLMRQYEDRFHEGTVVLVLCTVPSPFWSESEDAFQEKQIRYYRIMDLENMVDPDLRTYYLRQFSPLLTEDLPNVYAAFFRDVELECHGRDKAHLTTDPEQAAANAEKTWNWYSDLIDPAFPDGNPVMLDAYRDMLTRCQENGWKAVLFTPPYLKDLTDNTPEAYKTAYDILMRGLSEEFHVPYLDYSKDEGYRERYDYFIDSTHMNMYGAEVFEAQIKQDLQRLGIL